MNRLRRLVAVAFAALAASGCVAGYGRCLFLQPSRVTLAGTLHWRIVDGESHGANSGARASADLPERIAVLSLTNSAYVYAPSQSRQCLAMQDVELEFSADPPETLRANSRITVKGSLYESTSERHRTRFVLSVMSLEPSI
jgi:hypothetical protein